MWGNTVSFSDTYLYIADIPSNELLPIGGRRSNAKGPRGSVGEKSETYQHHVKDLLHRRLVVHEKERVEHKQACLPITGGWPNWLGSTYIDYMGAPTLGKLSPEQMVCCGAHERWAMID